MAMQDFPKPSRRSPFKRKPLRLPGQSIQDEMNRILEDRAIPIVVVVTIFALIALYDWMVKLNFYRPQPWFSSVVALLGIGYLIYKYFDFKRVAERLRLARDGERIVGQFLEDLRAGGARVFHDLIGDSFNIDMWWSQSTGSSCSRPNRIANRGRAKLLFDSMASISQSMVTS